MNYLHRLIYKIKLAKIPINFQKFWPGSKGLTSTLLVWHKGLYKDQLEFVAIKNEKKVGMSEFILTVSLNVGDSSGLVRLTKSTYWKSKVSVYFAGSIILK